MNPFYVVNNNLFDDKKYAYGEQLNPNLGNPICCEECRSYLSNKQWLPPHEIKVSKTNLGDFIFGTFEGFILSKKAKLLIETKMLIGIKKYFPVKIYFKNKILSEEYYYPKISISEAKIDLTKSEIKFDGENECKTCQRAGRDFLNMKGLYFKAENTIREDIFRTNILPDIIISDRFKEAAELSQLTNLKLLIASKFRPIWML